MNAKKILVFASILIFGGISLFADKIPSIKSETQRNIEVEESLIKEFSLVRGEDKISYLYNKIDLDGDKKPEIIVYAYGPMVGGTGGDSGLILKERSEGYDTISKFTNLRVPIIISDKTTHGWKDIILEVYGGGGPSGTVVMKFDGKKYPSNPSVQALLPKNTKVNGVKILSDNLSENPGISLEKMESNISLFKFFPESTLNYSGGFENSGYTVVTKKLSDDLVIQKFETTAITTSRVIKITPESATVIFLSGEDEEYVSGKINSDLVIMKLPLEKGNTWKSEGNTYEIDSFDGGILVISKETERSTSKYTYEIDKGLIRENFKSEGFEKESKLK
ncbi:hypothetical protein H3N56_00380 [Cetobacterium sp. 2A]|uniref:hypothetical protein n=1 Tax=Cetobacterium sp. 2A TaxID=2754723 RepID=UPI00163B9D6B|nr:hypothetical protein [Cetobacterium sp. 2A]MBC2854961.1 hypothetical protein [Cetobacterium sp. 2A]